MLGKLKKHSRLTHDAASGPAYPVNSSICIGIDHRFFGIPIRYRSKTIESTRFIFQTFNVVQ